MTPLTFNFGFPEPIGCDTRDEVYECVGRRSVSSVFQSHAGFQLIEQSFDDEPPSQQDFVQDWQEIVFHVAANAGDEVEPTLPEPLEEGFGDIALINLSSG